MLLDNGDWVDYFGDLEHAILGIEVIESGADETVLLKMLDAPYSFLKLSKDSFDNFRKIIFE